MGNPQHYSRDLPQRCLRLIEALEPHVQGVRAPDQPHLGALNMTFLLAMATPIITLPIERLERRPRPDQIIEGEGYKGYINDRTLDPKLDAQIDAVFRGSLSNAPFFVEGAWQFSTVPIVEGMNLATAFPDSLASSLGEESAKAAAARMSVPQWAAILRNSLAHGTVTYLDEHGCQSHGTPAKYFAFAGEKRGPERRPEAVQVLRIATSEFREFLTAWTGWLQANGITEELAA